MTIYFNNIIHVEAIFCTLLFPKLYQVHQFKLHILTKFCSSYLYRSSTLFLFKLNPLSFFLITTISLITESHMNIVSFTVVFKLSFYFNFFSLSILFSIAAFSSIHFLFILHLSWTNFST